MNGVDDDLETESEAGELLTTKGENIEEWINRVTSTTAISTPQCFSANIQQHQVIGQAASHATLLLCADY